MEKKTKKQHMLADSMAYELQLKLSIAWKYERHSYVEQWYFFAL